MNTLKPSWSVYVAEADHAVKVGITCGLEDRIRALKRASGTHVELVRNWPMPARSIAFQVEHGAHWLLRDTRVHGEWFSCHPFEAVDAVERSRRHGAIYYASLQSDGEAFLARLNERVAA